MKLERITQSAALLALTLSWGCAQAEQFQGLVKERAAFDLQCDTSSLEVTDLPGMAYGVRGCGQQATYVVTGALCQNPKQLTKREVRIYCTPLLDHDAGLAEAVETATADTSPESAEPEPAPPEPVEPEPAPPEPAEPGPAEGDQSPSP